MDRFSGRLVRFIPPQPDPSFVEAVAALEHYEDELLAQAGVVLEQAEAFRFECDLRFLLQGYMQREGVELGPKANAAITSFANVLGTLVGAAELQGHQRSAVLDVIYGRVMAMADDFVAAQAWGGDDAR